MQSIKYTQLTNYNNEKRFEAVPVSCFLFLVKVLFNYFPRCYIIRRGVVELYGAFI